MTKCLMVIAGALVITTNGYAQTASAAWALTADTLAVVTGSVTAPVQMLYYSGGTMCVRDFSGGAAVGAAERIWLGGANWPTESEQNNGRYAQYSVSPTSGYGFTAQSVTLNIGCYGTVGHFFARIYCSTDSMFATSTQLTPAALTLPDVRTDAFTALSYTPGTTVNPGQTFYLRIYPWYDGSASATKYLCLSDLVISGATSVSAGSLTLSVSSLNSFQQTVPVPSTTQSYTVSGVGLIDNVTITPPVGYEISANGGTTWHNNSSPLLLTESGGVLPGQPDTIVVRLNASSGGAYGGNIAHVSTGALMKSVAVSGLALAPEPTVSSSIAFGSVSGDSMVVNFSGGNGNKRILVAHPGSAVSWAPMDGSAVSGESSHFFTATDQGSGNKVVYEGAGSSVLVTGLSSATTYYFAVYEYNVGTDNSQNYLTTSPGTGSQTSAVASPALSVNPTSLSYGNLTVRAPSGEQTYVLSGSNLNPASGGITVTAPNGYQVSTTSGYGFTSSVSLRYSSGGQVLTTIYVRFLPTAVQSYDGKVTNEGGGATAQYVAVSGAGVSAMVGGGYFVSSTGNDSSPGTISQPFATIAHAVSVVSAGDTIHVFGDTYSLSSTITISRSGTRSSKYCLFAYPGERPILDFSSMAVSSSNRGISLSGSHWYIRGFDVCKAGDNGMYISGSNNIIEFCALYENNDSGLQLDGGASNNTIINCDSYFNADPPDYADADGFAAKMAVGSGNYFYGCRSWQNVDDGWDGYLRGADDVSTAIENCWTFDNGYLKDGTDPGSQANGNGFKMGGSDAQDLRHNMTLKRCLAFGNKSKGFDQNHNKGSMTLHNCTGHNNGADNYSISEALASGKLLTVTNCVEFGNKRSVGAFVVQTTNSWMSPFVVDASDFESLDTAGVHGPRKPDGSLPDITFMHLASSSGLIDKGTDVGLLFNGSAPDLGCFETETGGVTSVASESTRPHRFELGQNYPNPFNPSTNITFSVDKTAKATLDVFNLLGQKVLTLFDDVAESGTSYKVTLRAGNLSSGVYFYRLQSGMTSEMKKLIVLK